MSDKRQQLAVQPTHCRCGQMLTTHRTQSGVVWTLCPTFMQIGTAARKDHDGWVDR